MKNIFSVKKNKYILIILVILFCLSYYLKKKDNFVVSRLNKELVLFSMKGCSHCEKLKPVWKLLKNNLGENQFIEIKEIVMQKRPDLIKKYNVATFPTILYLRDGKKVQEYKGDRTYKDLLRFTNYSISN